ncbi:hypothetical protein MRX96_049831 [Rhipicephalus microplus]
MAIGGRRRYRAAPALRRGEVNVRCPTRRIIPCLPRVSPSEQLEPCLISSRRDEVGKRPARRATSTSDLARSGPQQAKRPPPLTDQSRWPRAQDAPRGTTWCSPDDVKRGRWGLRQGEQPRVFC